LLIGSASSFGFGVAAVFSVYLASAAKPVTAVSQIATATSRDVQDMNQDMN